MCLSVSSSQSLSTCAFDRAWFIIIFLLSRLYFIDFFYSNTVGLHEFSVYGTIKCYCTVLYCIVLYYIVNLSSFPVVIVCFNLRATLSMEVEHRAIHLHMLIFTLCVTCKCCSCSNM